MNQNTKAKREFPYVALILVVTIVLVVAILGYAIVDGLGVISHFNTAATSNNYKINENIVDVYRYHAGKSELTNMFYYIKYYGMTDPYGTAAAYGTTDAMAYVYDHLAMFMPSRPFDEAAYSYAEQYLTYCEGARKANVYDTLKAESASDIDAYVAGERELAETLGLSFSSYLKTYMGNGVSERDLREAMEYYYVGIAYAEQLQEEFADKVTEDEIKTFVEDHKSDFYTTKYTSYKLVNAELEKTLKDCETIDEVKTAIVDYYIEKNYSTQYKKYFEDAKVEDADKDKTKADIRTTILALNTIGDAKEIFKSDDTDSYKKAAYQVAAGINTSAKVEVNKVTEGGSAAYADPTGKDATDLQKWMFGTGRKKGDYTVIKTETKSGTGDNATTTTTYTWYLIEDAMVLDTELTKDAYYVKLTDDAAGTENALTAAQKVEQMYNELNAAKTPEKFAELVEKYAPGSSSELYETISYDTIKSTNQELADWLYSKDGRAEGDIAKFTVKKGGTGDDKDTVTAGYVAYFVEENEMTWMLNGRNGVANEKVLDWYDEAVVEFNVKADYEFATTAETTAAETTAAATPNGGETKAETSASTEAETTATTQADTSAETQADTTADTTADTQVDTTADTAA